jgi:hypothetical protein
MVRPFASRGQRGEPAHRRALQGRLRPGAGAGDPLRAAAGLKDPVPAGAGTGQLAGALTGLPGVVGRRPGCLARASTRPAVPRALMTHNDERSVRLRAEGVALASLGESEYAALASCATGMHAACPLRAFSAA